MSNASIYNEKAAANNNTDLNVQGNYSSTADGSGALPASVSAADTFSLNGYAGGTGSNANTFNGGALNLAGGTKTFATINAGGTSLITTNAAGAANTAGTVTNVSTFNAATSSLTYIEDTQGSSNVPNSENFTFSTLTGSGNIDFDSIIWRQPWRPTNVLADGHDRLGLYGKSHVRPPRYDWIVFCRDFSEYAVA